MSDHVKGNKKHFDRKPKPISPNQNTNTLVSEILRDKPWRGFWYGIFYPLKRFPLTAFSIPAWWILYGYFTTTFITTIVIFACELIFRTKYSLDMGKNEESFIESICHKEEIPPPLSKTFWVFQKWIIRVMIVVIIAQLLFLLYGSKSEVAVLNSDLSAAIFGGFFVYIRSHFWPLPSFLTENYNDTSRDIDIEFIKNRSRLEILNVMIYNISHHVYREKTLVPAFHPFSYIGYLCVLSIGIWGLFLSSFVIMVYQRNTYDVPWLNSLIFISWAIYIGFTSITLGRLKAYAIKKAAFPPAQEDQQ